MTTFWYVKFCHCVYCMYFDWCKYSIINLFICLSTYLFICLTIHLFWDKSDWCKYSIINLFICLSTYLFIYSFVYLFIYFEIRAPCQKSHGLWPHFQRLWGCVTVFPTNFRMRHQLYLGAIVTGGRRRLHALRNLKRRPRLFHGPLAQPKRRAIPTSLLCAQCIATRGNTNLHLDQTIIKRCCQPIGDPLYPLTVLLPPG